MVPESHAAEVLTPETLIGSSIRYGKVFIPPARKGRNDFVFPVTT